MERGDAADVDDADADDDDNDDDDNDDDDDDEYDDDNDDVVDDDDATWSRSMEISTLEKKGKKYLHFFLIFVPKLVSVVLNENGGMVELSGS